MELIELARAIRARDPARPSWLEALTCYAGVQAVMLHRLAHAPDPAGVRGPGRAGAARGAPAHGGRARPAGVRAAPRPRRPPPRCRAGLRAPARMISHAGRFITGIEIHPGAKVG